MKQRMDDLDDTHEPPTVDTYTQISNWATLGIAVVVVLLVFIGLSGGFIASTFLTQTQNTTPMSEPIISIAAIQKQAQDAARQYTDVNAACPYPFSSAAGQAFKAEFLAAREALTNPWAKEPQA